VVHQLLASSSAFADAIFPLNHYMPYWGSRLREGGKSETQVAGDDTLAVMIEEVEKRALETHLDVAKFDDDHLHVRLQRDVGNGQADMLAEVD
jgi:hypothetical protein